MIKLKKLNIGKIATTLTIVVLASMLIGVAYYWADTTITKFQKNWDVIEFAMDKPEFVRALKTDYASKSAELEKEYMKRQVTPEDELIQEVVDQVKGSKQ